MGHDVHFLSRLKRVSPPHAEFALSLCRDPELVRTILGRVDLPEGDTRVAISLGEGAGGPCTGRAEAGTERCVSLWKRQEVQEVLRELSPKTSLENWPEI